MIYFSKDNLFLTTETRSDKPVVFPPAAAIHTLVPALVALVLASDDTPQKPQALEPSMPLSKNVLSSSSIPFFRLIAFSVNRLKKFADFKTLSILQLNFHFWSKGQ